MCSFVIVLICIFSAIENITSSKREIYQTDPYSGEKKKVLVPVWNPTLANLTLMAFGSSAPEIFLSVIETVTTLGAKPGELGPSTIVGSAAFNFLVISAVSILSVNVASDTRTDDEIKQDGTDKGIKKIDGLVVFGITTPVMANVKQREQLDPGDACDNHLPVNTGPLAFLDKIVDVDITHFIGICFLLLSYRCTTPHIPPHIPPHK